MSEVILTASDAATGHYFGQSVAISADGSTIVVGSPNDGFGKVFVYTGTDYADETILAASDGASYARFGQAVDVSDDGGSIVVGAYGADSGRGKVYVYSGASWSTETILDNSGGYPGTGSGPYYYGDTFGVSVAISGDASVVLVGATWADAAVLYAGEGRAYVCHGASWGTRTTLAASDGVADAQFGCSVALSGDGSVAVVGAQYDGSDVGKTYVYDGVLWADETIISPSDLEGNQFGWSVDISADGTIIAVAESNWPAGTGRGRAFVYSDAGWATETLLVPPDLADGGTYGGSIAISPDGSTVAVGQPYYPDGVDPAPGRVVTFSGPGFATILAGGGSDSVSGDFFGGYVNAVDLSGDGSTFVIGAPFRSGGDATGAAYVNPVLGGFEPPPSPSMNPGRRVGIAFDDGPLEPDPTWTWLDDASVFPAQFVSGYDTHSGRQTLLSQTDTGTATVYVNDRAGLLDDRNDDSPYQGKLSGRQIILQLWNPVSLVWEPQFRGLVDNYSYDIDSATDATGEPINATVQIECVDMFDYLNGFGLTPTLAGQVPPPVGMEDGVYYAATDGTVQDRFFEILTDAHIDPAMYLVAQGNVKVVGVKYDPDESALTALRDAADAEFPFISNIYINRYGLFQFRGRYSRFAPDGVAAEPGSDWDFARWPVGDGKAIQDDPTRGQIRVLSYNRDRADLINAAMCWPEGLDAADMVDQVYAAAGMGESIELYGKHDAPPMSDLLTGDYVGSGTITPDTGQYQCFLYAKLLVENKKAPRIAISALQLKAMRPTDPRAEATWGAICGADISHIVNVAVGYPGGTGLVGDSPQDDYYIEGRSLTVRPLNPEFDYVECNLEVSPAIWSMDTHGVFPEFGS